MDKQELKIEHEQEQDRYYIPVGEKYEVQTRGRGSSYRILNKGTGHRELLVDECNHDFLTTMARDLHAEYSQLNARIGELEDGLQHIIKHQKVVCKSNKMDVLATMCIARETLNKGNKK